MTTKTFNDNYINLNVNINNNTDINKSTPFKEIRFKSASQTENYIDENEKA